MVFPPVARLPALSESRHRLEVGPSLTNGSMMFSRMLLEVVSVARPGSSEGGSVPQLTVIVLPSPPLPLFELLPPQETASKASTTMRPAKPRLRPSLTTRDFSI